MRQLVVGIALAVNCHSALAADGDCPSGDRWMLPPSKPKNLGQQYLVMNAPQAVRIKVCNCTTPANAESYVMINAYRAQASATRAPATRSDNPPPDTRLPNPNYSGRIYAGSCLDAGGTEIYVHNPSETTPAMGTYAPR